MILSAIPFLLAAIIFPPYNQLQYVFAHDALLEAVECGVHEVAARDLKEQYKRLGVLDSTMGLTKLEIEFDHLDGTIHRHPTKNVGTLNINKPKNRYANAEMVPCKQ